MADKEKFSEWIREAKNFDFEAARIENENQELNNESISSRLKVFFEMVRKNREGAAISTGFENLDEILDGGFYPGLYFLGANSSIGKTSFLLQIADNIARGGNGVLFFSLEMSANELIAKSLSRLTLVNDKEIFNSTTHAKTTRGILLGRYNETESELISKSLEQYLEFGGNLFITEGVGDVGIQAIKSKTEDFLKVKKKPPVIVVDYLQILAPYDLKMTDKQNTWCFRILHI